MSDLFGAGSPPVIAEVRGETLDCDIAVLGSGMGGGTIAFALRDLGARIIVVERGDFLPRERANWEPAAVFGEHRYRAREIWYDGNSGKPFSPGVHYWVGGNTKVYGACLPRFREEDFGAVEHPEGTSPAWPVSYAEMEPYYAEAERLYGVHGSSGDDPTEPWRSSAYPYPALEHEPAVADFSASLCEQGLRPFLMPMGVDFRDGGRCIRCRTCDGFPCLLGAKNDAEVRAVRPALESGNVRLLTRAYAHRLETSVDGKTVSGAVLVRDGRELRLTARQFIVACGAANSAALLLRSGSAHHPDGLGNSSGLLGRNYMVHTSTFLVAVDPRRRNTVFFQKTLGLNDWYLAGPGVPHPLGNVQMLGKLQGPMVKGARPWVPSPVLDFMTSRSIDLYLTTEDLPRPENRVVAGADGRVTVYWQPNNLGSHRQLVRRVSHMVRRAGYPLLFTQRMGIETNSHMCGTAVMGEDPHRSVLDPCCRSHDVANLWVVDSSCFPSSTALNPALTIAANALRVAAKVEMGN
jgi:choline dehydrogenase-like flavoprotein